MGEAMIMRGGSSTKVVDNLTSTDADKALSANQGKKLNDTISKIMTSKVSVESGKSLIDENIASNLSYNSTDSAIDIEKGKVIRANTHEEVTYGEETYKTDYYAKMDGKQITFGASDAPGPYTVIGGGLSMYVPSYSTTNPLVNINTTQTTFKGINSGSTVIEGDSITCGSINGTAPINESELALRTVNNLEATSNDSKKLLAAPQGKILNDKITTVSNTVSAVSNTMSALPIKSLEGQSVASTSTTTVIAAEGATIVGDTRTRTYSGTTVIQGNISTGKYSVTLGQGNTATGESAICLGYKNIASGERAISMGENCESSGKSTFTTGQNCISNGRSSMAGGLNCKAIGINSFVYGDGCTAGNWDDTNGGLSCSVVLGSYCNVQSGSAVAMGSSCKVLADSSCGVAIGNFNKANGNSAVAFGNHNTALAYQFKVGQFAKEGTAAAMQSTTGDAFIIGNGTSSTVSNAFRVTYAGGVYGLSAYSSSGADYAEYFEWVDGNIKNEDRRGRFVTLDGEKIRLATDKDDYILGVVSATPCIKGDSSSEDWNGKYLTDEFGQRLTQKVTVPAKYEEQEKYNEETKKIEIERVLVEEESEAVQWILNPDYNSEQEYIPREARKEWSAIGMVGKLILVDDGTCEVNGYCGAGKKGIATKKEIGYRVMSRIDENHIKVIIK